MSVEIFILIDFTLAMKTPPVCACSCLSYLIIFTGVVRCLHVLPLPGRCSKLGWLGQDIQWSVSQ